METGGLADAKRDFTAALLGRALADFIDDDRPVPTLKDNMQRLIEESRRVFNPPRFKLGDWVTPRSGVSIKGSGEPNLVIGKRFRKVKVISIVGSAVHARWIDTWMLETWSQSMLEVE